MYNRVSKHPVSNADIAAVCEGQCTVNGLSVELDDDN